MEGEARTCFFTAVVPNEPGTSTFDSKATVPLVSGDLTTTVPLLSGDLTTTVPVVSGHLTKSLSHGMDVQEGKSRISRWSCGIQLTTLHYTRLPKE